MVTTKTGKMQSYLITDLPNYSVHLVCEDCFKCSESYLIMLAHEVRCGFWRYGSGGWTFPQIFHYILLLCSRWQQRGSLTEWCQTWKWVWSKGMELNSSIWKKFAPIDIHWCLLNVNGDQIVNMSTVGRWVVRFSSGSPPLVQTFMSATCRVFFNVGKNA